MRGEIAESYATVGLDLSVQIDALTRQGISQTAIFMDKVSGAKTQRPGLTKCLATLSSGDILVVWRYPPSLRPMRHQSAAHPSEPGS